MHAVSNWTATLSGKSLAQGGLLRPGIAPFRTTRNKQNKGASEGASWGFSAPRCWRPRAQSCTSHWNSRACRWPPPGPAMLSGCIWSRPSGWPIPDTRPTGFASPRLHYESCLCVKTTPGNYGMRYQAACAGCIETYSELSLESGPITMEPSHLEEVCELLRHPLIQLPLSHSTPCSSSKLLSCGCEVLSPCSTPVRPRSHPGAQGNS